MKKIIYLATILICSSLSVNAAEKRDCSELKKLSIDYIACKAGNLKAGIGAVGTGIGAVGTDIVNTGGKVVKGVGSGIAKTGGKIIKGTGDTAESATKTSKVGIPKFFKKVFSGQTKQYPKGTTQ